MYAIILKCSCSKRVGILTQGLPLLEGDGADMRGQELSVVEIVVVPALVFVRVIPGAAQCRRRVHTGGGGVGVLRVGVEGLDGGAGVPCRGVARDRLRLVRDLRRAPQAHQQPSHQPDRAQL